VKMNETWDAIFSAITPFLCVFLIFGVILLIRRRHKFDSAVWAVAICTVFALIWRVVYALISSRYAMILVLPAVVLSCYVIWHLHAFFPPRYKKAVKYLQILLLIAVPLVFLAKSWNFSPYRNSLKELAEIARKDAANYHNASFANIDIHNESFEYYSGIQPSNLLPPDLSIRKGADFSFLKPLTYVVDSDNVLYFVIQADAKEEKEFVAALGKYPGSLTKLGERFVNKRKKKKRMLFRYCPPESGGTITACTTSTPPPTKNLFKNGDFEKVGPLSESARSFCVKKGMDFFAKPDIIIPHGVSVDWLGGYERNGEVEAVDNAIDGKYSMRMKNPSRFAINHSIKPGNYKFSTSLKALEDSALNVYIYCYDPKFVESRLIATRFIRKSDNVWHYEFEIPHHISDGFSHFWIVFILSRGEVLLDNVCLQKMQY